MGGFATPLVQTLRIRYQPTRALHDSPRTPGGCYDRDIEGEGRAHTKFGAVAQRARQPFVRPNRMALLRTCDLTLSKMISIMDGQASGNPCQNIILQFARLERTDRTQDACTKALVTCGRRLRADASSS